MPDRPEETAWTADCINPPCDGKMEWQNNVQRFVCPACGLKLWNVPVGDRLFFPLEPITSPTTPPDQQPDQLGS